MDTSPAWGGAAKRQSAWTPFPAKNGGGGRKGEEREKEKKEGKKKRKRERRRESLDEWWEAGVGGLLGAQGSFWGDGLLQGQIEEASAQHSL